MPPAEHLLTGKKGEDLTAEFLQTQGYAVLARNYRTYEGETDIIAFSPDDILCFVEVKTRAAGGMFPPSDAVTHDKQERLKTNAAEYMNENDLSPDDGEYRFDIAEVTVEKDGVTAHLNYIKNAF